MKLPLFPAALAALCATATAQTSDAPPVDAKQLLQSLHQIRDQSEAAVKARRTTAYQQVMAAAATNEKAAAAWQDAVLAVQFAGVDHQGTAVHDWKQSEGEALRSKEGANAARLHLYWLGLTLQHAAGTETKQLLNNIIEFTKQVEIDSGLIEKVAEQIGKAKERTAGIRRPPVNKTLANETHMKKLHDSIMKMSVTNGPLARRLQVSDLLGDLGKKKKGGEQSEATPWETVPGNVDGIYKSIILPEFRASRDPRLLDYWDLVIKRQGESVFAGMPDFEERQATQVQRPKLYWERAQDVMVLGQKNRALTEMFGLIKTYPQHPDVARWMAQLEGILAPAPATPPAASISSLIAPPAAVPSATTAGQVPTATVIPAPPIGNGTTPGAGAVPR